MSMKKGSTGISGAYVGTTEIKKIYRGTTLIFEKDTGGGGGGGGGGGITPNTDGKARFYLPAAATSFKVSANTSTGYFKISSPGKTDVIGREHSATGQTYYVFGGGANASMTGLSSGATKTVTVSSCTSGGSDSGNIIGIDIGSDSTNNVTAVDISGLTSLLVFNAGATGGTIPKFQGGGPTGSRSMVSSITEIRAVNVATTSTGGPYTTPYGPATTFVYGGGIDIYNQDLDATALNQLYTDLAASSTSGGALYVGLNPGRTGDNPSIVSGKYTVYGS